MLTQNEFREHKNEHARCPYGRDAFIGDKRCTNCSFNHIMGDWCEGDAEQVRRLKEKLGLDR